MIQGQKIGEAKISRNTVRNREELRWKNNNGRAEKIR